MSSGFDGIETLPPDAATSDSSFPATTFPRRLTTDALTTLRRRRTGPGRALRKPLQRRARTRPDASDDEEDDEDEEDEDEDEEDDEDDEDVTIWDIVCCCWGPRCVMGSCMLMLALAGWSAAITYGVLRQPTYENVVTPIRIAKQRWLSKTPQNAEESFILFDRNADGLIGVDDMAVVAKITTGEDPPHEQLVAYIARGDLDGDGALNEEEYMQMLFRERAMGKSKGKGGGKASGGGGGAPTSSASADGGTN
jgi:hypothetical protein